MKSGHNIKTFGRMINLEYTNKTGLKISDEVFEEVMEKFSEVLADRINEYLSKSIGTIDLVIVDDETIHHMNKEHRGKDCATDVISFAYLEVADYRKEDIEIIVGDIFISIDTAKKQAKENGHSIERELEVLFVHGLLHLFGFDHKNDKEEEEMESWAEKITSS